MKNKTNMFHLPIFFFFFYKKFLSDSYFWSLTGTKLLPAERWHFNNALYCIYRIAQCTHIRVRWNEFAERMARATPDRTRPHHSATPWRAIRKACSCGWMRLSRALDTVYTGWSTQLVHLLWLPNCALHKKILYTKVAWFKGVHLCSALMFFFYRWKRFEDLKVNFVFLNGMLYFLYQNMEEFKVKRY